LWQKVTRNGEVLPRGALGKGSWRQIKKETWKGGRKEKSFDLELKGENREEIRQLLSQRLGKRKGAARASKIWYLFSKNKTKIQKEENLGPSHTKEEGLILASGIGNRTWRNGGLGGGALCYILRVKASKKGKKLVK